MSEVDKRIGIIEKYTAKHNILSNLYYQDPANYPGGKVQFEIDHAKIWVDQDIEMIEAGFGEVVV